MIILNLITFIHYNSQIVRIIQYKENTDDTHGFIFYKYEAIINYKIAFISIYFFNVLAVFNYCSCYRIV